MIDSSDYKLIDRLQSDQSGFMKLSQILRDETGINLVLNDKNIILMASRMAKVFKKKNIENYKKYLEMLNQNRKQILPELISAMTTNTTRFFREPEHFESLKKIIPQIMDEKRKKHNYEFRIWCSASSTGQEVYTLLMVLVGLIGNFNQWSLKFLATDIDLNVLQKAADGIYSREEVAEIPEVHVPVFFNRVYSAKGEEKFQIKSHFQEMIRFAPFNLQAPEYPFQYPFDIIFCRNVLIYFEYATSKSVVKKLGSSLSENGYLFLGHSETGVMRGLDNFYSSGNSVYQNRK